jgi:hypothetical protein
MGTQPNLSIEERVNIARAECEAGDIAGVEHYRKAAEALVPLCHTYNKYGMIGIGVLTQADVAKAIGRSQAYVSKLLRWYRGGCNGFPFQHTKKDNEGRQAAKQKYSPENNSAAPTPDPAAKGGAWPTLKNVTDALQSVFDKAGGGKGNGKEAAYAVLAKAGNGATSSKELKPTLYEAVIKACAEWTRPATAEAPAAPGPDNSSEENCSFLVAAFDQRFHKMNAKHRTEFIAYVLSRTKIRAA